MGPKSAFGESGAAACAGQILSGGCRRPQPSPPPRNNMVEYPGLRESLYYAAELAGHNLALARPGLEALLKPANTSKMLRAFAERERREAKSKLAREEPRSWDPCVTAQLQLRLWLSRQSEGLAVLKDLSPDEPPAIRPITPSPSPGPAATREMLASLRAAAKRSARAAQETPPASPHSFFACCAVCSDACSRCTSTVTRPLSNKGQ